MFRGFYPRGLVCIDEGHLHLPGSTAPYLVPNNQHVLVLVLQMVLVLPKEGSTAD